MLEWQEGSDADKGFLKFEYRPTTTMSLIFKTDELTKCLKLTGYTLDIHTAKVQSLVIGYTVA
jgi:hypothetical protein